MILNDEVPWKLFGEDFNLLLLQNKWSDFVSTLVNTTRCMPNMHTESMGMHFESILSAKLMTKFHMSYSLDDIPTLTASKIWSFHKEGEL